MQRRRLLKQNNRLPKIDRYIIINVESYPMRLQKEIDVELEGNVLSSRKQPYSFPVSVARETHVRHPAVPWFGGR
jgi:hypothetical protein